MNQIRIKLFVISVLAILHKCSAGRFLANSTNDLLARNKRTLIYQHGGAAKFVMSVLIPVDLTDMRSLNWAINLQAQYLTPDKPFYNPWGKTRSLEENLNDMDEESDEMKGNNSNARKGSTTPNPNEGDDDYSREFIYGLAETIMNRYQRNGRACLQRAICETSQQPFVVPGLFGEVANAILIPPRPPSGTDDVYYAAHLAGVAGVDCLKQFPECPRRHGILERLSILT